jgi:transketolase
VLYPPTERFPIPGSKVVLGHHQDRVCLVGAGVTVHTCLAAALALAGEGIRARVVDAYTIKPLDVAGIARAARATGGNLVVVEDHHPEGGLGEAVLAALTDAGGQFHVEHLAVRTIPSSGAGEELLREAGLSASDIAIAARRLCSRPVGRGA